MRNVRRVLLFLIVSILGFTLANTSANAAVLAVSGVDIIYTNPGEDCMTEMTISWHSSQENSTLTYTLASDKNFENATVINTKGVFDNTSFVLYDVCSFYKCRVDLKNLTPDTEYIYKVSTGAVTSRVHKFKTAGSGDFTFGYMSDIHAVDYDNLDRGMTAVKKLQTVQKLIDTTTKKVDKFSFMLTTGDEVWRGSQYSNWLEWSKNQYTTATVDYMWAGAPGNHEYYSQSTSSVWNYYPDKYAADPSAIYSDPDYYYNTYFNAVKAVPQNGADGIASSYWFIYNNVLFVCIDSMQAGDYGQLTKLRNWFEEVVQANEGNYQYIIAYQHYHWFDFQTGADKYHERWNDLFDKYGVDLALSGHMHGYVRTKSLYNGKISTDELKGTTYVVSPQVGDRPKDITGYQNADLFAMRESTSSWVDFSAMSAITVTKEKLTYKLLDVNGEIKDEFSIKAKRPYNLKQTLKDQAKDSLTLSSDATTISANINPNYNPYLKNVRLIIDDKIVNSFDPATKRQSSITVKDLEPNKVHDVKVRFTYADDSSFVKTYSVVTSEKSKLIQTVNLSSNNGKMNVGWSVLENASKYKVLLDDNEVALVDGNVNNYDVDLANVSTATKYTVQALNQNGEVIAMNYAYYKAYGDANLDGRIDSNDVDSLINKIFASYEFSEEEVKLLDNNNDGKVDIGDAYRILSKANNKIETIKEVEYEVVVVDQNGNVLNVLKVNEGESLTYQPTLQGKTFKGYNNIVENITSNLVVVAIFE